MLNIPKSDLYVRWAMWSNQVPPPIAERQGTPGYIVSDDNKHWRECWSKDLQQLVDGKLVYWYESVR